MKKTFFITLLLLATAQAFCQSNKIVSTIQYDGVYIEVGTKQFVQLTQAPLAFASKYQVDGLNYGSWPEVWMTDEEKRTDVKSFKKIIISGYNAQSIAMLSIYPAQTISSRNVTLYSNARAADNYYTYKGETSQLLKRETCRATVTKIKENYYEVILPDGLNTETYLLAMGTSFWFFKSSTAVAKTVAKATKNPTAMGAYIKGKNGLYSPITDIKYGLGRYSQYKETCRCYVNMAGEQLGMFSKNNDYFIDGEIMQKYEKDAHNVEISSFEAIAIKGGYDFNNFFIYKLMEITMGGEEKKSIVTTESIKIDEGSIYMRSAKVEYEKRTNGDICSFMPAKTLEKGKYWVSDGKVAWVFLVK